MKVSKQHGPFHDVMSTAAKERNEADLRAGTAWRLLRRYKYRVRHLLTDVQKALDAMNQPHYESNDTELDNYYDAKSILEKIIENKR